MAGKVGYVGFAVYYFRYPGDVVAGHILEGGRRIPGIKLVAGAHRKRMCAYRRYRRCITGRRQYEVAARIVHKAAADGPAEMFSKPEAVVSHAADKILRGGAGFAVTKRRNATAVFKAEVARDAESGFIKSLATGVIIVSQQKAEETERSAAVIAVTKNGQWAGSSYIEIWSNGEFVSNSGFWEGCKSCCNYDILQGKQCKNCLCTAMLYTSPAAGELCMQ